MTSPRDPFSTPEPGAPWTAAGDPGQPGGWPGSYGPPPTQYSPPPTQPSTEIKAIIALVLAVLAYTPTVPFLGAIAALVLARMARRDILASGGRLTGLSLCTWAVVLAWVHLVLVGLLFLVLLAVFVLPFSFL
jgi:hypothetical protein